MIAAPELSSPDSVFMDFNGDGIKDILKIVSRETTTLCDDNKIVNARRAIVVSALDMTQKLMETGDIVDKCIPINNGDTDRIFGLHLGALHFGDSPNLVVISPQYYETSWFLSSSNSHALYTPMSSAFDLYTNRKTMLQPSARGRSWEFGTAPFNGIIINHNGSNRYVATSSGRFLMYDATALSNRQLLIDSPFLARSDIVGRNYGLLLHDNLGNKSKVFLIAGTGVNDIYVSLIQNKGSDTISTPDIWGGIERHVSTFDTITGNVEQTFFSYAHDQQDRNSYVNRVAYPANPLLPTDNPLGSKIIYNVFNGRDWTIHISRPGQPLTEITVPDFIVWDTIETEPGVVDLIVSPIDKSRFVNVPDQVNSNGLPISWKLANYLPKFETRIWRWNRSTNSYQERILYNNVIPKLDVGFPHSTNSGNGTGSIFTTQKIWNFSRNFISIVCIDRDGKTVEISMK